MRHHCWSPLFFLLLSNLFVLLWKWTPRGYAAYLPGRNGLSSIKLMEARWRAGHRGEELGQPPRRRQRVEEKERERGEHWFYFSLTLKSPVKVSSSPSVTYTCMQLARWTHARRILQHVHWSLLWAFNWWRTKSPQWRQARERIKGERERERDGSA